MNTWNINKYFLSPNTRVVLDPLTPKPGAMTNEDIQGVMSKFNTSLKKLDDDSDWFCGGSLNEI